MEFLELVGKRYSVRNYKPDEVEPVAFIPLGYPNDQRKKKTRKPIDELVHYEHW